MCRAVAPLYGPWIIALIVNSLPPNAIREQATVELLQNAAKCSIVSPLSYNDNTVIFLNGIMVVIEYKDNEKTRLSHLS